MQVTESFLDEKQSRLEKLGVGALILIGIFLCSLVVARMGLLNGLTHRDEAAISQTQTIINITAKDMRFENDDIRVQAGQLIMLNLDNRDFYTHSFDIEALNVHTEMRPNETTKIIFSAAEPGTYEFYCGIPGHQEAGMVGVLVVEP